jgi:signal transduction histidine kinase
VTAKWRQIRDDMARRAPKALLLWPGVSAVLFFVVYAASADGVEAYRQIAVITSFFAFSIGTAIFLLFTAYRAIGLFLSQPLRERAEASRVSYFLLSLAGTAGGMAFTHAVLPRVSSVQLDAGATDWLSSMFIGALVALVFIFRHSLKAVKEQVARLEGSTAEARYQTLKAQMQPHFLFNSLNSLSELITSDPTRASSMTERLADLYRRILTSSRGQTASLASEIAIIKDYLELERLRFGERLSWTVDDRAVDSEKVQVPSLILQTLVENAVKHGIAPSMEGGRIRVAARPSDAATGGSWVEIEVANTGAPPRASSDGDERGGGGTSPAGSTGTGLANSRERLTLLFGDEHEFHFGREAGSGLTVARFRVRGAGA